MAKRGPKPKHSLDRVLAEATTLVARNGLEALSMSALARALNSSVSGLYRYVDGHEHLLVLLQQQAIEGYRSGLLVALEQVTGPAELSPKAGQAQAAPPMSEQAPPRDSNKAAGSVQASLFAQVDLESAPTLQHATVLSPAAATDPSTAALASVIAFSDYYRIHAKTHPARHGLLAHFVASRGPLLSDEAARSVDDTLQKVLQLGVARLREARLANVFVPGDDQQRLHLIWAALHGLDQLSKRDRIQPAQLRSEPLHRQMLSTLLTGFGAKRSLLKRAFDRYEQCRRSQAHTTTTLQ